MEQKNKNILLFMLRRHRKQQVDHRLKEKQAQVAQCVANRLKNVSPPSNNVFPPRAVQQQQQQQQQVERPFAKWALGQQQKQYKHTWSKFDQALESQGAATLVKQAEMSFEKLQSYRSYEQRNAYLLTLFDKMCTVVEQQSGISRSSPQFNPNWALSMLHVAKYAASTKAVYAHVLVKDLLPHVFAPVKEESLRILRALQVQSNIEVHEYAAPPATSIHVSSIIRKMQTVEEMTVWLMWVTISRYSDICTYQPKVSMCHAVVTGPRATSVTYKFAVRLQMEQSKGDPDGRLQLCKWIACESAEEMEEVMERVQMVITTKVDYIVLLQFIRSRVKSLKTHSFRKGAIQLLQQRHGCTEMDVSAMAHHVRAVQMQRNQTMSSYRIDAVSEENAQRQLRLSSILRAAVEPSSSPRRQ
jgi:hypothetical protein